MDKQKEVDLLFLAEWNRELLNHLKSNPDEDGTALMQSCAESHYNSMDIDRLINPYVGKLEEFIKFLSNEWGWIVTYDADMHMLTADENKDHCVCPIVRCMEGKKVSDILCHCSEGFGKIMFGKIIGKEVKTEVVKSILRGDKSCVYRIWF